MAVEKKLTVFCAKWLALILAIGTAGASIASDSTATRSVTLQEQSGTSIHTYRGDNLSLKTDADSDKRYTLHHSQAVWLFNVSITLNEDHDNDGYYSDFSITFDFDAQSSTLVYAVLYVNHNNGPWIEYAVTGDFTIGHPNDSYTIRATLDSGYQTGHYDHYIELYDAYTHEYLARFGPDDSHVLHGLPFESTAHDRQRGISTSVTLNFSGTGSLDTISLAILTSSLYLIRRRKRRND